MKKLIKKIKQIRQKNKEKMQDIKYVTKLYKRSQAELLIAVAAFLALYIFNYGYTILKTKLVTKYIYTDALENMSKEHLGEKLSLRNFDYMTIALYEDELKKEDKYFMLFRSGTYGEELKDFKNAYRETKIYKTEDGAGVISLNLFAGSAVKKIKDDIEEIKDCDRVIIDLRNNPGGLVNSAKKLADMFLESGETVYGIETKNSSKTIKSRGNAVLKPKEIIILQNGGTASAAELFTMALKENLDNVTVVGTQSYGKGIGQKEYILPDGYAFKFTAIRVKTPSGGSINGVGIKPDIECREEDMIGFAENLKIE